MRTIRKLVLHCSATRPGQRVGVAEIDRWHRQRGFSQIGYHFVVLPDGTIRRGRDVEKIGAHAKGHNSDSIGICYIGGVDASGRPADTRTEAQRAALCFLLQQLRERFPEAEIVGHRDLSPDRNGNGTIEPSEWLKACPSFDAKEEYKNL